MIRVNRKSLVKVSAGIAFYKVFLHIVYSSIVYPLFSYQYICKSYSYDYSTIKDCLSWILMIPIIIILCQPNKDKIFSKQAFSVVLCLVVIPGLVLYVYNDTPYYGLYILYFFVFGIAMTLIPNISIKISSVITRYLFLLVGVMLIFSIYYVWIVYAKFHIQLSIIDVYGTRADAEMYDLPVLIAYTFSMSKKVVPLYAIYYIHKKKYKMVAIYSVSQVISFFVDGSKGTIFLLFVSVIGYIIMDRIRNFVDAIPWIMGAVGMVSCIEYFGIGTYYTASLIYRRVLFLPNLINSYYYDYFLHNEQDYFRQAFGFISKSPYESIPKLIGNIYMDNGTHANNGMFSDAYMNLGIVGVILLPILIVVVLKCFDGVTKGLPLKIYFPALVSVVLLFASASFFTNLLSHGMILMIIVLFCINSLIISGEKHIPKT